MLKLKIFGEEKVETKEVYLRLVEVEDYPGTIELVVTYKDGTTLPAGHLLKIDPLGYIHRYSNVTHDLGLQLDSNDKIKDDDVDSIDFGGTGGGC